MQEERLPQVRRQLGQSQDGGVEPLRQVGREWEDGVTSGGVVDRTKGLRRNALAGLKTGHYMTPRA